MLGNKNNVAHSLVWLAALASVAGVCSAKDATKLLQVRYITEQPLRMNMSEFRTIRLTLTFDKNSIPEKSNDEFIVVFNVVTKSPQFDVIQLEPNSREIRLKLRELLGTNLSKDVQLTLNTRYVGHARVYPEKVEFSIKNSSTIVRHALGEEFGLDVVIIKPNGIWDLIFVILVTTFITITYINLGAQLDKDNIKQMIEQPKTIVLGFLASVLVMPIASWISGHYLLGNQTLYRLGSFIFACGPAATASTLWTVMLDSDRELSVGLQVVSTVGALFTMPLLLYIMEMGLPQDGAQHAIQVPYGRLIQTLLVLLVALYVGWRFVGRNEKARKISLKIFRPLTFLVLIFIIVFSSIIYWYIYLMFDWIILANAMTITLFTYTISGLIGYLFNFNLDHAIAIAIGSTYKHSGITFAILLVAFEAPDTYIAFVPGLMQVLDTSLSLYAIFLIRSLVNCIRRRNQPAPIQATTPEAAETGAATSEPQTGVKGVRSNSASGKSTKSEENDEFIPMDVTDVVAGSPASNKVAQVTAHVRQELAEEKQDSKERKQSEPSTNADATPATS